MMLLKLLESMGTAVDSKVVVLMGHGTLSGKIESLGVDVEYLDIGQGRLPNPGTVLRMLSISRQFVPDVIQGWMYHGNWASGLAGRRSGLQGKLFGNIRQTLYDLACERRLTRWLIGLSRWLSSTPVNIIYNSELSARQHEAIGYPHQSRVVLPNGFDMKIFRPDKTARESVSVEFGLGSNVRLVVHAARYHAMKDHRTVLMAAKRTSEDLPGVRFLLVGRGVTKENEYLKSLCQNLGLRNNTILIGERFDLPRLMSAADIVVLSSAWGEGFPNVVGEAMACGTPCVVTDVGDSAWVVGECGRVVPPCDADALSKTIVALLSDNSLRKDLGYKARQRIQDLFSIEKVSKTYLDLYQGKLV